MYQIWQIKYEKAAQVWDLETAELHDLYISMPEILIANLIFDLHIRTSSVPSH